MGVWINARDFAILLSQYFVVVTPRGALGGTKAGHFPIDAFPSSADLRDEDVVLILGATGLHHSGTVYKQYDSRRRFLRNMVVSKIDEGPVLITELEPLLEQYRGDRLIVVRRRI
jgi:hypothetical protein